MYYIHLLLVLACLLFFLLSQDGLVPPSTASRFVSSQSSPFVLSPLVLPRPAPDTPRVNITASHGEGTRVHAVAETLD